MRLAGQLAWMAAVSLAASVIHYRVVGPPSRTVSCDPATLKPREICLEQVMSRWQGKVMWVDARTRAEWNADGLPGSVLWSLDPAEDAFKFEEEMATRLMDQPGVVIVYCGEGNCGLSHQVVERILKLGLVDEVYALHGGVGALRASGMLKGSS